MEKFDSIQQMGRFTLRDEGKTIAVGKVLKYKTYTKGIVGASTSAKVQQVTNKMAATTINKAKEDVYDMETGELKPKKKEMTPI